VFGSFFLQMFHNVVLGWFFALWRENQQTHYHYFSVSAATPSQSTGTPYSMKFVAR
jgi:hypothetical protein